MMIDTIKQAAISAAVSALISGIGIYYLHTYLDTKRKESEEQAAQRRRERRKADVLESKRRRAAGRMFFWLHDAVVKGVEHANGDLAKAMVDYCEIEDQQKAFEQELMAEQLDENRRR